MAPIDREGDLDSVARRVPTGIARALEESDLDTAAAWLLELPTDSEWAEEVRELAEDIARVFLTADPALASRILDRIVAQGGYGLDIALNRVEAAARRFDRGAALELANPIRRYINENAELDGADRAVTLSRIAGYLHIVGAFTEAQELYEEARDACPLDNDDELRRALLINLATVHADRALAVGDRGDVTALELLDKAEALGGNDSSMGTIWYNRAFVHGSAGRSAEAGYAHDRAEEHYIRAGSDPRDMGYLHRARAAEAGRNGRLDDAVHHFETARTLFMDAGLLDEAVTVSTGLLQARHLAGDPPDDAEIDEMVALITRVRPGEIPALLINLGNTFEDTDHARALAYYEQAEAEFRRRRRPVDVERARHSQAVMIRRMGNADRALDMLRGIREKYIEWGLDLKVGEIEFNMAVAYRDIGDNRALEATLRAFARLDRHRHELGTAADRAGAADITYPHLVDLAIQVGRNAQDDDVIAAIAERARTQTTLSATRLDRSEQLAPPAPVQARQGARVVPGDGDTRTLLDIAHFIGGPQAVWLTWVVSRSQIVRVVVGASGTEVSDVVFPSELLAELVDAAALTGFDESSAAVDDPFAGPRALLRIASGPLLDDGELAARVRRSLPTSRRRMWRRRRADGDVRSLFEALADALLPQQVWDAPSVVIAPPSFLGRVPWAALERGGRAWVEGTELSLAPPVSTMRRGSPSESPRRSAWIADTRGDLLFCRRSLPGWEPLMGAAATSKAVLAELSGADRVVVRGHVRSGTADRPRDAAVRLADADLTPEALAGALGSAVPREWVILGCDAAGAGVGDEWAGLPIGLGAAGADELVVTLWPIVDAVAQETLDLELVDLVTDLGLNQGLREWQLRCARRWRGSGGDPAWAPHRWAGHVRVVTLRGSG